MFFIAGRVKNKIKRTRIYQNKRAKTYFSDRKFMLEKLSEDEKPSVTRTICYTRTKTEQFRNLLKDIKITIRPEERFQIWIDTGIYFSRCDSMTDNQPPNYELIIMHSTKELMEKTFQYNNKVAENIRFLLQSVEIYIDRVIVELRNTIDMYDTDASKVKCLKITKSFFERMKTNSADSLEEALQRILFWSSIFWQSQHRLVGLGRLDKILSDLKRLDDKSELQQLIIDFYNSLHRYYAFKSNGKLMGDTGQIIVLGGIEADGSYYTNYLTYAFIDALMHQPLPDPKILLRVAVSMPKDLLQIALKCNADGVGCPLLSNDDVVIPALEEFGYKHEDACNYVTSACWEPLVYGKSLEKNNIACINYATPAHELSNDEEFETVRSFTQLKSLYFKHLNVELNRVRNELVRMVWEEDPLMSLFTEGCMERGKDISKGGAYYNNYGVLSVGMSNAVNSLFNIKYKALEGNISCREIKNACLTDYENKDKLKAKLEVPGYYGRDNEDVVALVKEITDYTYSILSNYSNRYGGKLKWGLSASNYMENGEVTGATMDGRKSGDPLAVHISAPVGVAYTELIHFASRLDYKANRSNGNVIDFFVSPELILENFDKFTTLILAGISEGFFQLQMNVLSSSTLIEAKEHPEMFTYLIVRVWGFSAYFVDLPDDYKNVLIKRAMESEQTA